jgi:hypothetical protein
MMAQHELQLQSLRMLRASLRQHQLHQKQRRLSSVVIHRETAAHAIRTVARFLLLLLLL